MSIRGLSDKSPDRVENADLVDLVDRVDRTEVFRCSAVESRSGGVSGVEIVTGPVFSLVTLDCCFTGVEVTKGDDTEPALDLSVDGHGTSDGVESGDKWSYSLE